MQSPIPGDLSGFARRPRGPLKSVALRYNWTVNEPSIGPCALCGTVGPLKLSHIIPRWMYRRLLHTSPNSTPSSLIRVDPDARSATFSSKQNYERLLCGKCEGRFGVWEAYVSKVAVQQDGTFPALAQTTDIWRPPATKIWSVGSAAALDCDAITKFAVSVVWRSGVSSGRPRVELGPYEPVMAAYLLGTAPFPPAATLLVQFFAVRADVRTDRSIQHASTDRAEGYHAHTWGGCGFRFSLLVGAQVPAFPGISFEKTRTVIISNGDDLLATMRSIHRLAVPMGRLAKLAPVCH